MNQQQLNHIVDSHAAFENMRPPIFDEVLDAIEYLSNEDVNEHLDRSIRAVKHDMTGVRHASTLAAALHVGWNLEPCGNDLLVC